MVPDSRQAAAWWCTVQRGRSMLADHDARTGPLTKSHDRREDLILGGIARTASDSPSADHRSSLTRGRMPELRYASDRVAGRVR